MGELCSGCHNIERSNEPRLKELSLLDPKTDSLISHFYRQWKGPERVHIAKVYGIRLPRDVAKARDAYRDKLTALGTPRQIQTFHSAQCICDLGANSMEFCNWESCGICQAIKSAFTVFEFGIEADTARWESGVDSYLDPSQADKRAVSTSSSPHRVMISCEVSLPPPRVELSKSSTVVKSYEEGSLVAVSGAEAIVPRYLILYSKLSTTSSAGSYGGRSPLG